MMIDEKSVYVAIFRLFYVVLASTTGQQEKQPINKGANEGRQKIILSSLAQPIWQG